MGFIFRSYSTVFVKNANTVNEALKMAVLQAKIGDNKTKGTGVRARTLQALLKNVKNNPGKYLNHDDFFSSKEDLSTLREILGKQILGKQSSKKTNAKRLDLINKIELLINDKVKHGGELLLQIGEISKMEHAVKLLNRIEETENNIKKSPGKVSPRLKEIIIIHEALYKRAVGKILSLYEELGVDKKGIEALDLEYYGMMTCYEPEQFSPHSEYSHELLSRMPKDKLELITKLMMEISNHAKKLHFFYESSAVNAEKISQQNTLRELRSQLELLKRIPSSNIQLYGPESFV
ncbi:Uncharacterised protein [Serratia quinivorans]|uniref:hypothetical protein n=1 Tax=Serratia quinivorans TaxID=137545 RepID=UPI0021796222|nr:hypothetical protein [Serratia quinivorans]CAI1986083.1 Uncharacterised protein [Serratia quinivorans]